MPYSPKVMEHYFSPRHVGTFDCSSIHIGSGVAGSVQESVIIKIQLKVSPQHIIEDACFKSYGCGYTIAICSVLCESLCGISIEDAMLVDAMAYIYELDLPPSKYHQAKVAIKALKAAVKDYRQKNCLHVV